MLEEIECCWKLIIALNVHTAIKTHGQSKLFSAITHSDSNSSLPLFHFRQFFPLACFNTSSRTWKVSQLSVQLACCVMRKTIVIMDISQSELLLRGPKIELNTEPARYPSAKQNATNTLFKWNGLPLFHLNIKAHVKPVTYLQIVWTAINLISAELHCCGRFISTEGNAVIYTVRKGACFRTNQTNAIRAPILISPVATYKLSWTKNCNSLE